MFISISSLVSPRARRFLSVLFFLCIFCFNFWSCLGSGGKATQTTKLLIRHTGGTRSLAHSFLCCSNNCFHFDRREESWWVQWSMDLEAAEREVLVYVKKRIHINYTWNVKCEMRERTTRFHGCFFTHFKLSLGRHMPHVHLFSNVEFKLRANWYNFQLKSRSSSTASIFPPWNITAFVVGKREKPHLGFFANKTFLLSGKRTIVWNCVRVIKTTPRGLGTIVKWLFCGGGSGRVKTFSPQTSRLDRAGREGEATRMNWWCYWTEIILPSSLALPLPADMCRLLSPDKCFVAHFSAMLGLWARLFFVGRCWISCSRNSMSTTFSIHRDFFWTFLGCSSEFDGFVFDCMKLVLSANQTFKKFSSYR